LVRIFPFTPAPASPRVGDSGGPRSHHRRRHPSGTPEARATRNEVAAGLLAVLRADLGGRGRLSRRWVLAGVVFSRGGGARGPRIRHGAGRIRWLRARWWSLVGGGAAAAEDGESQVADGGWREEWQLQSRLEKPVAIIVTRLRGGLRAVGSAPGRQGGYGPRVTGSAGPGPPQHAAERRAER